MKKSNSYFRQYNAVYSIAMLVYFMVGETSKTSIIKLSDLLVIGESSTGQMQIFISHSLCTEMDNGQIPLK